MFRKTSEFYQFEQFSTVQKKTKSNVWARNFMRVSSTISESFVNPRRKFHQSISESFINHYQRVLSTIIREFHEWRERFGLPYQGVVSSTPWERFIRHYQRVSSTIIKEFYPTLSESFIRHVREFYCHIRESLHNIIWESLIRYKKDSYFPLHIPLIPLSSCQIWRTCDRLKQEDQKEESNRWEERWRRNR